MSCCSCIFLVWLIFGFIAIAYPYWLCYQTNAFWKKQEIYFEHPEVDFTHKLVFSVMDKTGR